MLTLLTARGRSVETESRQVALEPKYSNPSLHFTKLRTLGDNRRLACQCDVIARSLDACQVAWMSITALPMILPADSRAYASAA